MKPPIVRLIWKCVSCGDVVVSYSHLTHEMNWCDCGKSAVDLDEHSQGITGKIEEISRKKLIMGSGWITLNQESKQKT